MRHTAFDLLNLGVLMLPCARGTKIPCRGLSYSHAGCDPDTINAWFGPRGRFRRSNVAVMCGRESNGLVVIDVENGRGAAKLRELGGVPLAPTIDTGGFGDSRHIWLRIPPEIAIPLRGARCWKEGDGPKPKMLLEIRWTRHLCLAPPSVTIEGEPGAPKLVKTRRWALDGGGEMAPWNIPIPEAPAWVVEALREPPPPERKPYAPRTADDGKAALRWAANDMAGRTCDRNNTLTRHVKWLHNDLGYSVDEIMPELLPAYVASGKDERGGRLTIQSAAKAQGVRP